MSTNPYRTSKPDFSTECLPGSVAEQEEKDRITAFRKAKEIERAEEARNKPAADAKWQKEYEEACKANAARNGRRFARSVYTPDK